MYLSTSLQEKHNVWYRSEQQVSGEAVAHVSRDGIINSHDAYVAQLVLLYVTPASLQVRASYTIQLRIAGDPVLAVRTPKLPRNTSCGCNMTFVSKGRQY
jgi:hypothetical protein